MTPCSPSKGTQEKEVGNQMRKQLPVGSELGWRSSGKEDTLDLAKAGGEASLSLWHVFTVMAAPVTQPTSGGRVPVREEVATDPSWDAECQRVMVWVEGSNLQYLFERCH